MNTLRLMAVTGLFLSFLLVARSEEAIPYLKVESESYSNLLVLRVTTTDLFFKHSRGFANVKLKSLPPDLQARFEFNPAKAAEAEKSYASGNAAYHRALIQRSLPLPAPAEATGTNSLSSTNAAAGTNAVGRTGGVSKAPEIVVEKWLGSAPDTRNKAMLVSFWAPWSLPSRKMVVILNDLQRKLGDKMAVIGISDESEEELTGLIEPRPEYSSGIDPQKRIKTALGVNSIPYVMIFDANGTLRWEGNPLQPGKELDETIVAPFL